MAFVPRPRRVRGTSWLFFKHGPEGCDENGPAAVPRPRDRLRIDSDMRPPRVRQLPTGVNLREAYLCPGGTDRS
jgi:hypothetical protein